MSTIATPPKAKLSEATLILFHIAARSHVLAEQFGVNLISPDAKPSEEPSLVFKTMSRPWLRASGKPISPESAVVMEFNPDAYALTLDACSEYTRHMRLWILNVWNSSYAKSKGWHFDLFKAARGLDDNNRRAIAWHLRNPIQP